MTPLGAVFFAATALAVAFGWSAPKSWKAAVGICAFLGVAGWALSYPAALLSRRLGVDTTLAEDYVNGFNARNTVIKLALALAWTSGCFGLTRLARSVLGRNRKQRDR